MKDTMIESGQSTTIWTIGHSTRPLEEFIGMLKAFQIELLVDIRSFPGSRKFPQFNKENLEISLPENNVQYTHLKKLAGRRKVLSALHTLNLGISAHR